MLLVSFVLNVLGVTIPFVEFRRGLSTVDYSLPRSIALLWDEGLYVLAAVIVAFSLVFPFAKLGLMATIAYGGMSEARSRSVIGFVERFGKWSMLDVFLVCLLIALANDQLLIGATPRVGILCFTSAIVLSMLAGEWMSAVIGKTPKPTTRVRSVRLFVAAQIVLLGVLVAALCVPFLQIDDWLLADRPISILVAIQGLWQTDARALAGIVTVFLVIAPILSNLASVIALVVRQSRARTWRMVSAVLHRWEMLDVFALALGIFLVEGRSFVRTELAWGSFLIALLLALYWPASALQHRRTSR
jgi:paraquat-inducible protein A